jgi:APA family basic amino acid/polyamine antiporter
MNMSESASQIVSKVPTTKDLKRVLGFGSLMSASVGQIIGAGIMSLMGAALAMTGRSAVISFGVAAVLTVIAAIPIIIAMGTVRMRGGRYTMAALLGGESFGGFFAIIGLFGNLSLAMYALSFADYFLRFVPGLNRQVIAVGVATIFWALNMFGIDKMAKVQNVIVTIMCVSLGLFAAFGIGKVAPGFFEEGFMTRGALGIFQASALLMFATGGATVITDLSGESKNPTRDIPLVVISSTTVVAVLYGFLAVVAGGVLPLEQVAGKPLTQVAEIVLPRPVFMFFMVGGAMFALATTLNSQFASAPKQLLQASVDGWLPQKLGYIHPRFKTPMVWLTFFYVITLIPIITGLDISEIGNMVMIISNILTLILSLFLVQLPTKLPEEWAMSKYKCSRTFLVVISILAVVSSCINMALLLSSMTTGLIIGNVIMLVASIAYCVIRKKTGKVSMEISYEVQ